jgi:hypothetical protein
MSGVGFWVVLSLLLLLWAEPQQWPLLQGEHWTDKLGGLTLLFGAYVLLSLPFDYLGGQGIARRHRRAQGPARSFWRAWLRGVALQGLGFVLTGALFLAIGPLWGLPGVLLVGGLGMLVLLELQPLLARLIGGLDRQTPATAGVLRQLKAWGLEPPKRVQYLAHADPAFTGGIAGLPGRERLVLPASWLTDWPADEAALQLLRRSALVRNGSRTRGVLIALAWSLGGLALASLLPGAGFANVAGLLTSGLGTTLWGFLGLLTLPSLSRPGVYAADRAAQQAGVPYELQERTMRRLDRQQDDEPARSPLVETIFHPVPAVAGRLAQLQAPPATGHSPGRGAWQAARMMLFLSALTLSFLPRAVHCNAGRPELWVFLPSD